LERMPRKRVEVATIRARARIVLMVSETENTLGHGLRAFLSPFSFVDKKDSASLWPFAGHEYIVELI
jgi:hypothetical protein